MTEKPSASGGRRYPLVSRQAIPPSYGRVVERLGDEELRAELEHERGTEEYREAVRQELGRREGRDRFT